MFSVVIVVLIGSLSGGMQDIATPGPGVCEIAPDAPYLNPRLPLSRLGFARRPRCYTTLAPPPRPNGGGTMHSTSKGGRSW